MHTHTRHKYTQHRLNSETRDTNKIIDRVRVRKNTNQSFCRHCSQYITCQEEVYGTRMSVVHILRTWKLKARHTRF